MTCGMIMEKCSRRGSRGDSAGPEGGQGLTHLSAVGGGWRLGFVIFTNFALS